MRAALTLALGCGVLAYRFGFASAAAAGKLTQTLAAALVAAALLSAALFPGCAGRLLRRASSG